VLGVQADANKKRLLEQGDALTFNKAMEIATAMEMTSKDIAGMTIADKQGAIVVNFISGSKKSKGKQAALAKGSKKVNKVLVMLLLQS